MSGFSLLLFFLFCYICCYYVFISFFMFFFFGVFFWLRVFRYLDKSFVHVPGTRPSELSFASSRRLKRLAEGKAMEIYKSSWHVCWSIQYALWVVCSQPLKGEKKKKRNKKKKKTECIECDGHRWVSYFKLVWFDSSEWNDIISTFVKGWSAVLYLSWVRSPPHLLVSSRAFLSPVICFHVSFIPAKISAWSASSEC